MRKLSPVVTAIFLLLVALPALAAAQLDPAQLEKLTGLKGTMNEREHVFKVSFPRDDLHVVAQGAHLNPALGLTAWAAFTPMDDHLMVMGDLVLTEDQVNTVLSKALDQGLQVTALHNHFFYESPKIMFMHIAGGGPAPQLATAIGAVFQTLKETSHDKPKLPKISIDSKKLSLDTNALDAIFGKSGDISGGVYKFTFAKKTKMNGMEVGAAMGVNTWAAFAGRDDQALVDGDFAMYEDELQAVLKTLRAHDINIVAIHNHMTGENPRVIFLHYWGVGKAKILAQAIKEALH